jgi:predicted AlkP superfamily phosphohydrolase/phosphomutase
VSDNKNDSGNETTTTTTTTANPGDVAIGKQTARKKREADARRASLDAGREQAREVGAAGTLASTVTTGGGGRPRRLLLIGLDGAAPELALGAWRTALRTTHLLTDRGARGRFHSSTPWASAPAWLSLVSGQAPGQLGIYGNHVRRSHTYDAPVPLESHDIHEPRLWDILGAGGKHVGIVGALATTPPPGVHGNLIGERPADGAIVTYPPALAEQVALWLEDEAPAQIGGDEFDRLIGAAYARTERRFRLARRLLARDTYDCFVLCDDGIAAVQRALWDTFDVTHPRYTPNHPLKDTISAFYRFVDEQIGELLELIDADTIVAIVSACGVQALDGEFALNDWLIEQGELALHRPPAEPTPLAQCDVDWTRTRAWAEDGAIYLNLAGREPQGIVAPDAAEDLLASLRDRLRALEPPRELAEPTGLPAEVEVYRPAALYGAARGVVPDLLAVCMRPGWRPSARTGHGRSWVSARDSHLDAACETPVGFFVIYDPHNLGGERELHDGSIYDIVPSLLALLGQPIAPRLRGKILTDLLD